MFKEFIHFFQNGSTVGLEPAITRLQVVRSANSAGACGWWGGLSHLEEIHVKVKIVIVRTLLAKLLITESTLYK